MDDFIYLVWSAKMKKERGRKRKKGKKEKKQDIFFY